MTDTITTFPPSNAGTTIYANFAAFPASASEGAMGFATDTNFLYVFNAGAWESVDAAVSPGEIALTNGQILIGNGSNIAAANAVTGDVTISNAGVTAIGAGVIVNADINASAAIDPSKLALPTRTILNFTASGAGNTTSASYVDVTGMTNQTVNPMIAGTYLCYIEMPLYSNTSSEAVSQVSVLVDGTTTYEIAAFTCSAVAFLQQTGWVSIPLTAGSHTFRPQIKKAGGGTAAVSYQNGDIAQIVLM